MATVVHALLRESPLRPAMEEERLKRVPHLTDVLSDHYHRSMTPFARALFGVLAWHVVRVTETGARRDTFLSAANRTWARALVFPVKYENTNVQLDPRLRDQVARDMASCYKALQLFAVTSTVSHQREFANDLLDLSLAWHGVCGWRREDLCKE